VSRPRRSSALDALTPAMRYALTHGRLGLEARELAGKAGAFALLHPSKREHLRAFWQAVREPFLAEWAAEHGDDAPAPLAKTGFGDEEIDE
jgi:hypothetical protein